MRIHVTATKQEVLESLQALTPEDQNDKILLEAKMSSLITNAIDDSIEIAGFNTTVTIEDM